MSSGNWLQSVEKNLESFDSLSLQKEVWPKVFSDYIANYLSFSTSSDINDDDSNSFLGIMTSSARVLNYCFNVNRQCNWLSYCQRNYSKAVLSITSDLLSVENASNHQLEPWLLLLFNLFNDSSEWSSSSSTSSTTVFNTSVVEHCIQKLFYLMQVSSDTQELSLLLLAVAALASHAPERAHASFQTAHSLGADRIGEASLHLINSLGYPISHPNRLKLVLIFLEALLSDKASWNIFYKNDFKILVEIIVRECTDLPVENEARLWYIKLLRVVLQTPSYVACNRHRSKEVLAMIESLLSTPKILKSVKSICHAILLESIQVLD